MTMFMHLARRTAAGMLFGLFVVGAVAQSDPEADALYPAPIRAFEIAVGQQWRLSEPKEDHVFYRAAYYGALLDSRGTPFKDADHLDLDEPKLVEAGGDRNQVRLRIQDGRAEIGGGFFDANGVMPLQLAGIETLRLRGTGSIAGDLDGDGYRIALGLESPPLRVPGPSRAGISNWLILGVAAQRQEAMDDDAADNDSGIATGALFLGKALGWRKSADVQIVTERIAKLMLDAAPTRAQAEARAEQLRQMPAQQRSKFQQLLLDALAESASEEDWAATIGAMSAGTADAITDQPTLSLYLEASGWYDFTSSGDERERRGLVTLTADYWPLAERNDFFLRLRYELGYERARPTERLNQVMLSLSIRL
jgi:hypothetical protein